MSQSLLVMAGALMIAVSALLGLGLAVTRERTPDPYDGEHREDVEVAPWN